MPGPSGTGGGGGEGAPGVSGRSSSLAIPQAQEDADYIEWLKGQKEIQNPDTLKELVSEFPSVATDPLNFPVCLHPAFSWKLTLEWPARSTSSVPFFSLAPCGLWDLKVPNQGSNPCPLQWKRGVLTTGPPEESPGAHPLRMGALHLWASASITWGLWHLLHRLDVKLQSLTSTGCPQSMAPPSCFADPESFTWVLSHTLHP